MQWESYSNLGTVKLILPICIFSEGLLKQYSGGHAGMSNIVFEKERDKLGRNGGKGFLIRVMPE